MLVWLYISSTLHIAVLQPGRLLQQPYIASIGYISSRRAENIINYVKYAHLESKPFCLFTNSLAFEELVQPGGYVDKTMLIGRTGMFNIIKERWAHWDVKEDGNLLKNLEKRGVADTEALPNYPYRDDAVPLWEAINRYVTTVVESVYGKYRLQCTVVECQGLMNDTVQQYYGEIAGKI